MTHVLNTAGVACPDYHPGVLTYKTLHLYDSPREDISTLLYEAIEYIDASIEAGGRVFVHCHQVCVAAPFPENAHTASCATPPCVCAPRVRVPRRPCQDRVSR